MRWELTLQIRKLKEIGQQTSSNRCCEWTKTNRSHSTPSRRVKLGIEKLDSHIQIQISPTSSSISDLYIHAYGMIIYYFRLFLYHLHCMKSNQRFILFFFYFYIHICTYMWMGYYLISQPDAFECWQQREERKKRTIRRSKYTLKKKRSGIRMSWIYTFGLHGLTFFGSAKFKRWFYLFGRKRAYFLSLHFAFSTRFS